ncbi:MAG: Asp23/Gls24 family envelope stress response protein [Simkaniaceae bacterium]|nr:Asp23/Gls24 family envelope stress response protein [Simkaniaceae bacterium]
MKKEEKSTADQFKQIDTKELDFPDTVFVRDIETRVFQAITIKCLSTINDISLIEGNIIDNLLGREGLERVKGIHVEQDSKSHSVTIKIELNVAYGISLPEKAEEIQSKLVSDIVKLTGLHVSCVHVIFKNLLPDENLEKLIAKSMSKETDEELKELSENVLNEYSEEF